jgi:hypothetical protein
MTRIEGGVSTRLNPNSRQEAVGQSGAAPEVGAQVQQTLFGRATPPVLDPARFPELAAILKQLRKYKKKLATMAGDKDEDYELVLAESGIAMIDSQGTIYLGASFLKAFKEKPEVVVGALAHEIGHRPKRWSEYKTERRLSRAELDEICRYEETRADIFAGKALAEMGLPCEPLVAFLGALDEGPHAEYFPAEVRAEVLRDAHAGRTYRAENRKKLFPDFDRMTAPKGHLGEY